MTETYIGKSCKRGHSGERYLSSRNCVGCAKQNRELGNPEREKIRARQKIWYEKNRDYMTNYREAKRQLAREQEAAREIERLEQAAEANRLWHEQHEGRWL